MDLGLFRFLHGQHNGRVIGEAIRQDELGDHLVYYTCPHAALCWISSFWHCV
jgi:hypothetical protein